MPAKYIKVDGAKGHKLRRFCGPCEDITDEFEDYKEKLEQYVVSYDKLMADYTALLEKNMRLRLSMLRAKENHKASI